MIEDNFFSPQPGSNCEKPGHIVREKHGCILEITIEGELTKHLFFMALGELLNHPDYYDRHSLWNLLKAKVAISFRDMKEVAYLMRMYTPERGVVSRKSAIVVSGALNVSIAKMFIEMFNYLPFEYRTFEDYSEAITFLKG